MKGRCEDCFYLRQELCIGPGTDGRLKMFVDKWCIINQVFKRLDGYCDFWEAEK